MNSVAYGNRTIEYAIEENNKLKSHYITVEKGRGVVLKGKVVSKEKADALILKKAAWIFEKLELVRSVEEGDIQTGSRYTYLGRSYYVSLVFQEDIKKIKIEFTHSKFNVYLSEELNTQGNLKKAFEDFIRLKSKEKIIPRIQKWVETTGLDFNELKFMKLDKRWGSCTDTNNIIINIEAVKLPWSLIDYLIVHELVHTKVKSHSKEFWAELSKFLPKWKELDERMGDMKI